MKVLLIALACLAPQPTGDDLVTLDSKGVEPAVERCVEILLSMQESIDSKKDEKSEWPYEGVYREAGQIPPGYRVGGTSISAWALLEAPGWKKKSDRAEAVERATVFVLDMLETERMSAGFSGGYDVRGWGHAYALNFMLRLRELKRVPTKLKKRVDTAIADLVETLEVTAIEGNGGWNYSRRGKGRASTFMTAPTLQFLFYAKEQGEKVDGKIIERALRALEESRLESGAFQYGWNPDRRTGEGFEAVEGSTGRSPVCEVTLLLAGRGSVDAVRGSLDDFFEHWEWLEKRRRQNGTHVPPYMIAPYYFFFAHYYAAQAIEYLPEAEQPAYRAKFYAVLDEVREASGGFNDRVFERSENFGTAMSLLGLLAPESRSPATWSAPQKK